MKQEKRTAKDFSGRTTPASGAMCHSKGDVRTSKGRGIGFNDKDYLIENKYTDKDFFILQRSTWEKIAREALRDNFRKPMMQIDIMDLQLIVIAENTFKSISEGWEFGMLQAGSLSNQFRILYNEAQKLETLGKIYVCRLEFLARIGLQNSLCLVIMLKKVYFEMLG